MLTVDLNNKIANNSCDFKLINLSASLRFIDGGKDSIQVIYHILFEMEY